MKPFLFNPEVLAISKAPIPQSEVEATDRVVAVAARFALNEYLKYSAYICQPDRSFQPCNHMFIQGSEKLHSHEHTDMYHCLALRKGQKQHLNWFKLFNLSIVKNGTENNWHESRSTKV